MGIILEHLQTHRDNIVVVNKVGATLVTSVADTTLVVMDPTDLIFPPATASQPLAHASPSRLVAAYPWGMPHNYNSLFANGNPFMSYQPFAAASATVNPVAFPWGMHNSYSAQGVEKEETHVVNSAEEQEPEYMGPPLNFHISVPPVQPNPYAFATMIPPFPNNITL